MNLFPHEIVREQQDKLMEAAHRACETGGSLVVHAPTGLGKTAAVLAPTIAYAIAHEKTVIFMTSRHTQHKIVLETIEKIQQKHNIRIPVADIVGKKWCCLQPGAERLRSKEFAEYCKALRADKQCEYYENCRKGEELTPKMKETLVEMKRTGPHAHAQVKQFAARASLCPYEVALLAAKEARVIVADYSHCFTPQVRDNFLARIGKDLSQLILIVDEAHNLPDRTKEAASDRISTILLKRAASEAEKHHFDEQVHIVRQISELLEKLALSIEEEGEERYITKEEFERKLAFVRDTAQLTVELEKMGDIVREEQQSSYLGALGAFLKLWRDGADDGFTRILSESTYRDETTYTISYRCLDPSVLTGPVLGAAHASILMSGTLSPTRMYKELLGALRAEELQLTSPFPSTNRLVIVIPKTTTKYSQRNDAMYREIGEHVARSVNAIPGNSAVFFPSYRLLEEILVHVRTKIDRSLFIERQEMTREEKLEFLERFRSQKDHGGCLLGVITGNFAEGVDLPGDELNGVVVVGLPLQKPDLETQALIKYFDNKFGRGWEYGYTYPAFNKTLQSAGRAIRSEHDRGVMIFLDERYTWPQYRSCFPQEWDVKATLLYESLIREFFEQPKTLAQFESKST